LPAVVDSGQLAALSPDAIAKIPIGLGAATTLPGHAAAPAGVDTTAGSAIGRTLEIAII
jgi:hypothetical protein